MKNRDGKPRRSARDAHPRWYDRCTKDWWGEHPRTRKQAFIALLGIPAFLVAAIAIAALVDFATLSKLWRAGADSAELAECALPTDVPRGSSEAKTWCAFNRSHGEARAYAEVGYLSMHDARMKRALHFFERAAERGSAQAYSAIGFIVLQGGGGQVAVDRPRAIAAFETSFKLGHYTASGDLQLIYEGRLGRGPVELLNAAMWAFGRRMVLGYDEAGAVNDARGYGLTPAQIADARERMRRWLEANNIPIKSPR